MQRKNTFVIGAGQAGNLDQDYPRGQRLGIRSRNREGVVACEAPCSCDRRLPVTRASAGCGQVAGVAAATGTRRLPQRTRAAQRRYPDHRQRPVRLPTRRGTPDRRTPRGAGLRSRAMDLSALLRCGRGRGRGRGGNRPAPGLPAAARERDRPEGQLGPGFRIFSAKSDVLFRFGYSSSGTGTPRCAQSGSHPSPSLCTSNRSAGTVSITAATFAS